MQPDNTVGYCAVVCPKLDFWQAYFICDTESIRQSAALMQMMSLGTAAQANPYGTLQAALAQGAVDNKDGTVAAAALALKSASKHGYFIVMADIQIAGTSTRLIPLKASNPDDARREIENHPEVRGIKERLITKMGVRDGLGRRSAFH